MERNFAPSLSLGFILTLLIQRLFLIPFWFHLLLNSTNIISCVSREALPQTNKTGTPERCSDAAVSDVLAAATGRHADPIWADWLHAPCHESRPAKSSGEWDLVQRWVTFSQMSKVLMTHTKINIKFNLPKVCSSVCFVWHFIILQGA